MSLLSLALKVKIIIEICLKNYMNFKYFWYRVFSALIPPMNRVDQQHLEIAQVHLIRFHQKTIIAHRNRKMLAKHHHFLATISIQMLHFPVKVAQFNSQIPVRIQIQQQHHEIITMDMKYQTISIWFTLIKHFFYRK